MSSCRVSRTLRSSGTCFVGVVAWRVGKWRRSKIRAASQKIGTYAPTKVTLVNLDLTNDLADSSDEKLDRGDSIDLGPATWKPLPPPPQVHVQSKKHGPSRFLRPFLPRSSKPTPLSIATSPPPAYSPAAAGTTTTGNDMLKAPVDSAPIQSPLRTASIGPDSPLYKTLSQVPPNAGARRASSKPLPRMMIVVCAFVPSLSDELPIRVGEPLRLVEEYEDEWCLVQRVGGPDADRGVIPRFCLQDVPAMQSARKHGARVSSSLART